VTWWPFARRGTTPPPAPDRRPGNGGVAAARRTAEASQRRLERDQARVDEYTALVREILGGRP